MTKRIYRILALGVVAALLMACGASKVTIRVKNEEGTASSTSVSVSGTEGGSTTVNVSPTIEVPVTLDGKKLLE